MSKKQQQKKADRTTSVRVHVDVKEKLDIYAKRSGMKKLFLVDAAVTKLIESKDVELVA